MMMIMLSPNPFSLFCAILLCLPLALIFTISSTSTTTTTTTTTVIIPSTVTKNLVTLASPPLIEPFSRKIKLIKITQPLNSTNSSLTPPPPSTPTTPFSKEDLKADLDILNPNSSTTPPPLPPPPPPPPTTPFWVVDERDDSSLLSRASRVKINPTQNPKKIAFMFLTTSPLTFAPVWELFFNDSGAKGKYNVYVHADPGFAYDPPFSGVFSGRVIPSSKPTRRNTPSLVTAARRLLAHALLDDPGNQMFAVLSTSCIPLHSFNFTYNTLAGSTKSFIEILNNESTAYGRWAARGEDVMMPEVGLDAFRIGSQFWIITRSHACVVIKDVKLWRKFRLPCVTENTCFPEENYFPTLLSMVDPDGIVPATLTNVNWEGQWNGHPHTYNASEVSSDLIQWLRERRPRYGDLGMNGSDSSVTERWDPFLFARKFAPNCVPPLVSLAKDVLFKD